MRATWKPYLSISGARLSALNALCALHRIAITVDELPLL